MGLSQDIPSRIFRLLFTVALVLAWCQGPSLRAQAPDAGATPRDLAAADVKALADGVERLFKAVEKADQALPRDSFDVAAVVASVGKEPQKLFEWVRDQTRWVPYRGALRGASGVLQDRLGNDIDRSLLLAELLRAAGHDARLARGRIPPDRVAELLPKLTARRVAPPAAAEATAAQWDQALDQQAKEQGLDPQQFRRNLASLTSPVLRMSEDLAQRVAEQTPALLDVLSKNNPAPAPDAQGGGAKQAAEALSDQLSDHWWVQLSPGNGTWSDLDPSLPDAKAGAALARADKTIPLAKEPGQIPLDAALCQEVTVRVVTEQWKDGRLKQSPVFTTTLRPGELHGKRLVFGHTPLDWPADLDLSAEADPAAKLRDVLLRQHAWVPTLTVGDRVMMQAGVSDAGVVDPKPALDATAGAGKSVGGAAGRAADLLDKLDEPAPQPKPKPRDGDGVLTAEWLEFEFRAPGRQPQTERRDVFDLLGPAARDAAGSGGAAPDPRPDEARRLDRAGALAGTSEIVLTACRPSPALFQHLFSQNLLAGRAALREMLAKGAAGDERAALKPLDNLSPLPAAPYVFAVARWAWSPVRDAVYVDRPNVVAYHRRFAPGAGNGLLRRATLDVIGSGLGAWPAGDAAGGTGSAFEARLRQGVVDANLEAVLLAGARPDAAGSGALSSTSNLFARSAAAGVAWVTLRSESDPGWSTVQLPPDDTARVRQELRAGSVVVVPVRPLPVEGGAAVGWWRVDPATGQALAMTAAGGSSMTEYALKVLNALAMATWTFIGCGGAAPGASGGKMLGCAVCAALAGVIGYLAMAGALAAQAGATATGAAGALGLPAGVVGGTGLAAACGALSAIAS